MAFAQPGQKSNIGETVGGFVSNLGSTIAQAAHAFTRDFYRQGIENNLQKIQGQPTDYRPQIFKTAQNFTRGFLNFQQPDFKNTIFETAQQFGKEFNNFTPQVEHFISDKVRPEIEKFISNLSPTNYQTPVLGGIRKFNRETFGEPTYMKAFNPNATKEEQEQAIADLALSFTPMGYAKVGKVGTQLGKQALTAGQQAAKAKLAGLINYSDDLMRRGLSKKQIEKISYNQYLQMGQDLLDKTKFNEFKNIFSNWIAKREVAKTTGFQVGSKFNIPESEGFNVISYMENPNLKVSEQVKHFADSLRKEFDSLYSEANRGGLNVDYLKDYITHIWKEPQEVVEQVLKSAGQKFRFAKERMIPTYEEGIKAGLTPKYTNPTQIIAEYTQRLNQTKVNLEFIKDLKKAGFLFDKTAPGLSPVVAPGFSKTYFAPTRISGIINRVFAIPDEGILGKALEVGRKVSGTLQDITLSGGMPKSALNAFGIAQLTKEFLAGRIVSPIMAFARSFSGQAADDFFKANIDTIKKMQARNVPISTTLDINHLVDRGFIKNSFGTSVSEAWNKTINDPTFRRFMPMLQVNLFKDIEKTALNSGKSVNEAADIASKAVQNFYGLTGTGIQALRSKLTQDFVGTVFFAPKFRESMVNFWLNEIKMLKNPLALENRTNIRFAVGAVLTYLGMNYLNKQLTGKDMADNPPGTEDKLLIPMSDGTTLGIPFLSSIATVPRALYREGRMLLRGDVTKAIADAGRSYLSIALKPLFEVGANEDYFGRQIVKDNEDVGTRYKKIGQYLAVQYLGHPYLRELLDVRSQDDPAYQRILRGLEAPFRFYASDKLDSRYYYANRDEILKGLNDKDRAIFNKLHSEKTVDEDGLPVYNTRSEMANALDRLTNPQVLRAEAQIALLTAQQTNQQINPFYLLNPKQQEVVLMLKTFYPGDTTKSQITKANIEWLQPYWTARDAYVADLKSKGIIKESSSFEQRPTANAALQAKLDFYQTLPSGTGARTRFLRANPEVLQFFQDSRNYTNLQRADLGLPLLADFSSFGRRVYFKKPSLAKLKLTKPKTIKAPKIKLAKGKMSFKPLKIKAPKKTTFKIKTLKSYSRGRILYG